MKTGQHSEPRLDTENPFLQMLDRLTGLARHWGGPGAGSMAGATPDLTKSLEATRDLLRDTTRRQFEIATKAQARVVRSLVSLPGVRSPQEALARQAEVMEVIAQAGAEHSTAWAECCKSIRALYTPSTRSQAVDPTSGRTDSKAAAPESGAGVGRRLVSQAVKEATP